MAQTTRSGTSDAPPGIYTTGASGNGYRGRTGTVPALTGYDAGAVDGVADGLRRGFATGFPVGAERGGAEGEQEGLEAGGQLRIVPLPVGYDPGFADGYAAGTRGGLTAGLVAGGALGFREGESAGLAEGAAIGFVAGVGTAAGPALIVTPVLSSITPAPLPSEPGEAGAFSVDFRVARLTPIEFDITSVGAGANIAIMVLYADRNETYLALDAEGVWRWPFDVAADNVIGDLASEPVHVRMLPRGGWPPTTLRFQIANARAA